jgi:hypothetical protein
MHNVPLSGPLMDFTMQQSRQGPTDMLDTVSTLALQNDGGRQARVYSKALVEENGKPSRRQDRVPRR